MTNNDDRWQHLNPYERRYSLSAIQAYDEIMLRTTDVIQISERYRLSLEEVKRAKNFAFGDGVSSYEFSPSPDMADAWLRMSSGKETPLDEVLLRHEIYESDLVINQGLKQSDAHKLAQEKYPWSDLLVQSKKDN
jgi:hypothetical protein